MDDVKHPCDWPKQYSLKWRVARYFAGESYRYGGCVPVQPFLDEYKVTRDQIIKIAKSLRRDFRYFIVPAPGNPDLFVCSEWPTYTLAMKWDSSGRSVLERVVHSDPRLDALGLKKTKFRELRQGTAIGEIGLYLLRHRSVPDHFCDATYLYKKYGSRFVNKQIRILNKFYGFNIRKPSKVHDNIWVVDRHPNTKIGVKKGSTMPEPVVFEGDDYEAYLKLVNEQDE